MAAQAGRDAVLNKNSVALAGMRQLGLTFNAEPIDTTDADDDGVRTLLAGSAGSESIDLSFEGVWKNSVIRAIALGGPGTDKLLTDLTLDFADGDSLSGDFFLNNYAETGEHKGEVTFTCSFLSSETWTYTPAV